MQAEERLSNGLIEQGEDVLPIITTNGYRVKARCRSILFYNDGTARAYINGLPFPAGATRVISASDGGILIQDFVVTFDNTGTKAVWAAAVYDYGQATNIS